MRTGESHANADRDSDGNSHSDSDANCYSNSYAYTNSDANCYSNSYAYADSDAYCHSNGYAYTNSDANCYSNSYAYADSYAYCDANFVTASNADGPAERKPDTKATSDTAASAIVRLARCRRELTIDTAATFGVMNAAMPRPLRIQYAGPRYHVMSRGDRREAISTTMQIG